jgi:hypothetical protein
VNELLKDSKEYGLNLNIIIILINNSTRKYRRPTRDIMEEKAREDDHQQRIDAYTKTLIKLCKSTPEGFLLQIDDKHDLYKQEAIITKQDTNATSPRGTRMTK